MQHHRHHPIRQRPAEHAAAVGERARDAPASSGVIRLSTPVHSEWIQRTFFASGRTRVQQAASPSANRIASASGALCCRLLGIVTDDRPHLLRHARQRISETAPLDRRSLIEVEPDIAKIRITCHTEGVPEYCTCGAKLPEDALFCHKCGKPQREDLIVAEPPPPPPPFFLRRFPLPSSRPSGFTMARRCASRWFTAFSRL